MIDMDELLALTTGGPPDEFTEIPAGPNLPLLFSVIGILLSKWGGEYKVTEKEVEAITGSHLKILVNYKTKEVKVVVVDPNSPWNLATPGVEPGHA